MDILLKKKQVYGNDRYYPANKNAELICRLTGQKTFNLKTMNIVQKLGYTIQLEQEEITAKDIMGGAS